MPWAVSVPEREAPRTRLPQGRRGEAAVSPPGGRAAVRGFRARAAGDSGRAAEGCQTRPERRPGSGAGGAPSKAGRTLLEASHSLRGSAAPANGLTPGAPASPPGALGLAALLNDEVHRSNPMEPASSLARAHLASAPRGKRVPPAAEGTSGDPKAGGRVYGWNSQRDVAAALAWRRIRCLAQRQARELPSRRWA